VTLSPQRCNFHDDSPPRRLSTAAVAFWCKVGAVLKHLEWRALFSGAIFKLRLDRSLGTGLLPCCVNEVTFRVGQNHIYINWVYTRYFLQGLCQVSSHMQRVNTALANPILILVPNVRGAHFISSWVHALPCWVLQQGLSQC